MVFDVFPMLFLRFFLWWRLGLLDQEGCSQALEPGTKSCKGARPGEWGFRLYSSVGDLTGLLGALAGATHQPRPLSNTVKPLQMNLFGEMNKKSSVWWPGPPTQTKKYLFTWSGLETSEVIAYSKRTNNRSAGLIHRRRYIWKHSN